MKKLLITKFLYSQIHDKGKHIFTIANNRWFAERMKDVQRGDKLCLVCGNSPNIKMVVMVGKIVFNATKIEITIEQFENEQQGI